MRMLLVVAGVVLSAAGAAAFIPSQLPDIGGTWVATTETPETVAAAPSSVFGERFAWHRAGDNLALVRPVRGRTAPDTVVFPLDGTVVTAFSPSRPCMGQSAQLVSVAQEGQALRYSIVGTMAAGATQPLLRPTPFDFRFRPLSADVLVVETTMRDSASAEPRAVGTVYRRSADTLAPGPPSPVTGTPARIAEVAWMSGDWIGTTSTSSIEERWSTGNGGAMLATSRTLRGDVMTEFEFLCIFERDGTLIYTAMPNAGTATDFSLTMIDADSATFENPSHDFPKMIRYAKRADGGMDATISGGGASRPTTFSFTRKR